MPPEITRLWTFLPLGFALTVALEVPVLLLGLSPPHSLSRRLFAGIWLTACTYPIVILVLPLLVTPTIGYTTYVTIAELFAPLAECLIFWLAYDRNALHRNVARDMVAIVAANLTSWLVGSWLIETWMG